MAKVQNDFEEKEYWQYQNQRFEAALRLTIHIKDHGYNYSAAVDLGIEYADELLAKLEETRTKTDEDTAF